MADQIFVQHRFTLVQNGQSLTDALVLPIGEYNALSAAQITALKQQRFDNWQNLIKNPPAPVEPSKAEKLVTIDKDLLSLDEQKQTLLKMKTDLQGGK